MDITLDHRIGHPLGFGLAHSSLRGRRGYCIIFASLIIRKYRREKGHALVCQAPKGSAGRQKNLVGVPCGAIVEGVQNGVTDLLGVWQAHRAQAVHRRTCRGSA